jgi:hypothetical protein
MFLFAACSKDGASKDDPQPSESQESFEAGPIEEFTGGRTKIVWAQQQNPAKIDAHAVGNNHLLFALDTGDGKPPHAVLPDRGNYAQPMITPDGQRIVFTRKVRIKTKNGQTLEPTIEVVNFDGSGLRPLGDGYAQDIWQDPDTGIVWVYAGADFIPVTTTAPCCERLVRFQLDSPERRELVWDKTQLSMEMIQFSPDGKRFVGLFPWPAGGLADPASGTWTPLADGCWTAISPDANYNSWVFDANHEDIHLFDAQAKEIATVALNTAPETRGHEVYHPRWSNHPEFIVVTGPYGSSKKKKGAAIEIYLGKFSPELDSISGWLKVTDNQLAEIYPDVWISPRQP